jgi:hypothetical protein
MWPTCEHGTISRVPPHIQVLNESSRFSPPQMSKSGSYMPSFSKKALSMEKSPPVGRIKLKKGLVFEVRNGNSMEFLIGG